MGIGLGAFERLASMAKRALRHDTAPGVRRVASGEDLPWRKGLVGWTWALLITLSFLAHARRQHARGIGVVVYDRHLPDALVSLDFVYRGANLRFHRALIKRLLPRAAVAVYLRVPKEIAVARAKAGETFGDLAVGRQLEGYETTLRQAPGVREMDGTQPPEELARQVLRWIVAPGR